MSTLPFGKKPETPVVPERVEIEEKAMEGLEAIEVELEAAETERGEEQGAGGSERENPAAQVVSVTTPVPAQAPTLAPLDPIAEKIEDILEEGLADVYRKMPSDTKMAFKQKGEETVSKIRQLLTATKVNAKKIFDLLREWLKLIPGINQFFLEQEAKIKTDKILFMDEQEKKM